MEETNNTAQVAPAPSKFNSHKVFAAIGIILTVTILILAGLWWYFWGQIDDRSTEEASTVKVSTSSAKPSTNSATPSAE